MEENKTSFKKYVYVSSKVRVNMEEILSENKIIQVARFINNYDIEVFYREQLKNLKGVNFCIIDLSAFLNSNENDIIRILKMIREFYECRIILIAEGYKQGDSLLGKVFNLGIYNIITASNDLEFKEQFRKTVSDEGMTFGNAIKYQIEETTLNIGSNKTLVKENFVKVKQIVNVGVVSTEKHSGATTMALNITKYLNSFDNVNACYIENNNHNTLIEFTKLADAMLLENKRMINYNNLDLYLKPTNIAEIQKYDYSFYVYDFGNFDELSRETKNNFISRDIKIIVSGSQIWEEDKLADCLSSLGDDRESHLFIRNIKNEDKNNFKKSLPESWRERTYFSELILDPFEIQNKDVYDHLFKKFLLNQNIKEEKKKRLFSIFKGGTK